jgi:hypothetical protein
VGTVLVPAVSQTDVPINGSAYNEGGHGEAVPTLQDVKVFAFSGGINRMHDRIYECCLEVKA